VESFSDIPQSVLLRLSLTAEKSCCSVSETESCPSFQSGMMSAHSTENPGRDKLMSSVADFRAKTFPVQEKAQASPESAADCGRNFPALLAKYDPSSSSWKIPLCLFQGEWALFSETWPRWGMMRNGECWVRIMSAHLTKENASGLWPTPTKHNAKEQDSPAEATRNTPTLCHLARGGDKTQPRWLNPQWVEWLMGWPIGWTDLQPLEMDKYQLWLQQHGKL